MKIFKKAYIIYSVHICRSSGDDSCLLPTSLNYNQKYRQWFIVRRFCLLTVKWIECLEVDKQTSDSLTGQWQALLAVPARVSTVAGTCRERWPPRAQCLMGIHASQTRTIMIKISPAAAAAARPHPRRRRGKRSDIERTWTPETR